MGLTKTQSGGLEDQSVTLDKLPHGDGSSDGKFLRANNGADPSFETVSTDLVADTSPQLGGNLDAGSHSIIFDDNSKLKLGNNNDLQIYHDGTNSHLLNTTNALIIRSDALRLNDGGNTETMIKADANGAVELYHDNVKTLETINNGIKIHGGTGEPNLLGTLTITGGTTDDDHQGIAIMPGDSNSQAHIRFGYGSTLKWQWRVPFHSDGSSAGMHLYSWDAGTDVFKWDNSGEAHARGIRPLANNTYDLGTSSNRWRNVYTNDLHLSNEGHSNDVDGTWGNWTIQEGESDLFLKNNRSGKKYKFNLTEVS